MVSVLESLVDLLGPVIRWAVSLGAVMFVAVLWVTSCRDQRTQDAELTALVRRAERPTAHVELQRRELATRVGLAVNDLLVARAMVELTPAGRDSVHSARALRALLRVAEAVRARRAEDALVA